MYFECKAYGVYWQIRSEKLNNQVKVPGNWLKQLVDIDAINWEEIMEIGYKIKALVSDTVIRTPVKYSREDVKFAEMYVQVYITGTFRERSKVLLIIITR